MNIFPKHLVALAGTGLLASASLLASATPGQKTAAPHDRFVSEIETVLSMNATQKDQAQSAINKARDSAKPIRQELQTNSKALEAAVRSDNPTQIERLSATVGQEIGRLVAIRSEAVADVYKTLTPDQRTKADALQQLLTRDLRQLLGQPNTRSGS